MVNEIRLDKKMFEVLSSDTRRKILVELKTHPLTVTDLSRIIGIQKSAVFEHLQILTDVGLVYKKDSDNKFVYYDLTENGKAIIDQDSNPGYKIYIILTSSIVSLAVGFLGVIISAANIFGVPMPIIGGPPAVSSPLPTSMPNPSGTIFPTPMPIPTGVPGPGQPFNVGLEYVGLAIGVCLIIAGLILLYYSLRSINANKSRGISMPFIPR
jgi:DNA-binding transcriptional ArsR family regulator